MKKLKKIVTLLTLAAVCLAAPGFGKLTVKAAEPTTYVVRYLTSTNTHSDGWYFEVASAWDDNAFHRETYYMMQDIKDGDYVVIETDASSPTFDLNFPVRLGNLTVNTTATVVPTAKGYDSVYILDGSTASINGDVSHAYVYGSAHATFINNVDTLEMLGMGTGLNNLHAYIGCQGTVNHLIAKDNIDQRTYFEYYNFAKNKLDIYDGSVKTEEQYYSKTAPAATAAATPEATAAPAATTATAPAQSTTASGAYDNVPKTGESALPLYLAGAAVLFVVSGYALRKKNLQ